VYKDGAKSLRTTGSVCESTLNMRAIAKLYPHEHLNNHTVVSGEEYYKVWSVACASGESFSVPGDSGSWVWNNGKLVGMIFGAHASNNEYPNPVSYITSWKSVEACILKNPRIGGIRYVHNQALLEV
jgi:hypothetical protein